MGDIVVYRCPICGSITKNPLNCKGPSKKRHRPTARERYPPEVSRRVRGPGPDSLGHDLG